MTNDGERRKPILDRKTKKETPTKATGEREKPGSKDRKKDSLGQPVDTTGGRTLGTGGAAPGDGHGGRPPRGRRASAEAARLGFRIDLR